MENITKLNKALQNISKNEKTLAGLVKLEDIREYVNNNSIKAIAKESKASLTTVKKYLQPIKNEIKQEKIELCLELHASGATSLEIATELGQSDKTIKRWIQAPPVVGDGQVKEKINYKELYEALMVEHKALLAKMNLIPTTSK